MIKLDTTYKRRGSGRRWAAAEEAGRVGGLKAAGIANLAEPPADGGEGGVGALLDQLTEPRS